MVTMSRPSVSSLLLVLLASSTVLAQTRPNPQLTPGLARPLSRVQVCTIRWGRDVRHVTTAMRMRVAAAYGVPWADRRQYEFDHLIPRELAGADDERNLWPEPLPEARQMKDRLENRLHVLVCARRLSLRTAQQAIAADWFAAYQRYVMAP